MEVSYSHSVKRPKVALSAELVQGVLRAVRNDTCLPETIRSSLDSVDGKSLVKIHITNVNIYIYFLIKML